MALTKTETVDKIEIVGELKTVLVRYKIVVEDDGEHISTTYRRAAINCQTPDGSGGFVDTDISSFEDEVQAQANAAWTDEVKTKFVTHHAVPEETDVVE